MNWLRRLGLAPPTADRPDQADQADRTDRTDRAGQAGPPHPARGPDTGLGPPGPAAPSVEGAAPGITALLEGLDTGAAHSVLDLGRAAGAKLDLYTPVARRMRFVDLLETGGTGWADAVKEIPAEPDHPYDLVLAWDLLDRMPPRHHAALVSRLARVVPPQARLHLLVAASEASLPELFRFTPLGPGRLRYDPTNLPRPPHPRLHPAEVERILEPFRVTRAFTLKVGFREFVAIRGSGGTTG
jgi:hypothetical protein